MRLLSDTEKHIVRAWSMLRASNRRCEALQVREALWHQGLSLPMDLVIDRLKVLSEEGQLG